ncbi:hypothetical protein [Homoserinimonas sp. OAct 916]|uniref:hypothetical protein n=1 Tax=Homoserinimonas sp. OAct 916 TaxID=2211450 RepID=UPI000DBE0CC1|nr:hypothetical protein [Homoserinimonas sp. OAct 916]
MTNLAVQLADAVKSLGMGTVYGDPIEVEGVTLVPVSLAYYGFGGGSDASDEPDGSVAGGGGGGGMSIPVGAYIKDIDGLRFRPNLVTLMAVSIPMICVSGWAMARVIRALKK